MQNQKVHTDDSVTKVSGIVRFWKGGAEGWQSLRLCRQRKFNPCVCVL